MERKPTSKDIVSRYADIAETTLSESYLSTQFRLLVEDMKEFNYREELTDFLKSFPEWDEINIRFTADINNLGTEDRFNDWLDETSDSILTQAEQYYQNFNYADALCKLFDLALINKGFLNQIYWVALTAFCLRKLSMDDIRARIGQYYDVVSRTVWYLPLEDLQEFIGDPIDSTITPFAISLFPSEDIPSDQLRSLLMAFGFYFAHKFTTFRVACDEHILSPSRTSWKQLQLVTREYRYVLSLDLQQTILTYHMGLIVIITAKEDDMQYDRELASILAGQFSSLTREPTEYEQIKFKKEHEQYICESLFNTAKDWNGVVHRIVINPPNKAILLDILSCIFESYLDWCEIFYCGHGEEESGNWMFAEGNSLSPTEFFSVAKFPDCSFNLFINSCYSHVWKQAVAPIRDCYELYAGSSADDPRPPQMAGKFIDWLLKSHKSTLSILKNFFMKTLRVPKKLTTIGITEVLACLKELAMDSEDRVNIKTLKKTMSFSEVEKVYPSGIYAFNAKQGDCTLIVLKDQRILIDGGYGDSFRKDIWQFVRHIKKLDLVIVTHDDNDHTRGIEDMLEFKCIEDPKNQKQPIIGQVWLNHDKIASKVRGYKQADYIKERCEKLNIPHSLCYANLEPSIVQNVRVISPSSSLVDTLKQNFRSPRPTELGLTLQNTASICTLLDYQRFKALFTADAPAKLILDGLKSLFLQDVIRVDYMDIPHHGSKHNYKAIDILDFFRTIQSTHYVVSTNGGKHNHPDLEVLKAIVMAHQEQRRKDTIFIYSTSQEANGQTYKEFEKLIAEIPTIKYVPMKSGEYYHHFPFTCDSADLTEKENISTPDIRNSFINQTANDAYEKAETLPTTTNNINLTESEDLVTDSSNNVPETFNEDDYQPGCEILQYERVLNLLRPRKHRQEHQTIYICPQQTIILPQVLPYMQKDLRMIRKKLQLD